MLDMIKKCSVKKVVKLLLALAVKKISWAFSLIIKR